jgi:hypothetical protein
LKLSGSWERRGRNPLVGALVLVVGLGALYMLVQGLLVNGFILQWRSVARACIRRGAWGVRQLYRRYRPVILTVLTGTQF